MRGGRAEGVRPLRSGCAARRRGWAGLPTLSIAGATGKGACIPAQLVRDSAMRLSLRTHKSFLLRGVRNRRAHRRDSNAAGKTETRRQGGGTKTRLRASLGLGARTPTPAASSPPLMTLTRPQRRWVGGHVSRNWLAAVNPVMAVLQEWQSWRPPPPPRVNLAPC